MRIGILTFYREINFGANIQALSTYGFLEKNGHVPIFIYYYSEHKEKVWGALMDNEPQPHCHRVFVDSVLKNQTEVCRNANDINNVIKKYNIDGVLVGSDAVLQHHPLRDRLRLSKRCFLKLIPSFPDTTFPNPYWGVGINKETKMAIMSASSQDSEYYHFSKSMKKEMRNALSRFTYISVRDTWTKSMVDNIMGNIDYGSSSRIKVTPDPVFNFNENAGDYIPSEQCIKNKFSLPANYVLISLFGQHLSMETLNELKYLFGQKGIACVALPMQLGYLFKHPFDYEIPIPLKPTDWYALIKYSQGYIGNNMHPVVVALHNSVPCYSLDFYGVRNFFGRPKKVFSSKIYHILKEFSVERNYKLVIKGKCAVSASEIFEGICRFPNEEIRKISKIKSLEYKQMMTEILNSWTE